jgi:hypothetical protein
MLIGSGGGPPRRRGDTRRVSIAAISMTAKVAELANVRIPPVCRAGERERDQAANETRTASGRLRAMARDVYCPVTVLQPRSLAPNPAFHQNGGSEHATPSGAANAGNMQRSVVRRPPARCGRGAGVVAALLVVGCSGYTTEATNIAKQPDGSFSVQLNFVASCRSGEHCWWYVHSRRVGTSTWTNVHSTHGVPPGISRPNSFNAERPNRVNRIVTLIPKKWTPLETIWP